MGTPEQNVSFICIKHHYLSCHFLYRMAHIMIANLVKLTFYTSFQPVRYHGWFNGLRWLESKWQVQRIACYLKVYRSIIYICNSLNTIQRTEPTIRRKSRVMIIKDSFKICNVHFIYKFQVTLAFTFKRKYFVRILLYNSCLTLMSV